MSHNTSKQIKEIIQSIEITSFDDVLSFEYWTKVQAGKLPVPEFMDDRNHYDDDDIF